jgi:hypothetical protein
MISMSASKMSIFLMVGIFASILALYYYHLPSNNIFNENKEGNRKTVLQLGESSIDGSEIRVSLKQTNVNDINSRCSRRYLRPGQNIEALQTLGGDYFGISFYSDGSCSGSRTYVEAYKTEVCLPVPSDQSDGHWLSMKYSCATQGLWE